MHGPNAQERWLYWQYRSQEHINRSASMEELGKLIRTDPKHKPALTYDEITTVRKNLESRGIDVDNEFVSTLTFIFCFNACGVLTFCGDSMDNHSYNHTVFCCCCCL